MMEDIIHSHIIKHMNKLGLLAVMPETAGCGMGPKSGKGCKGSSDVNTEVN
jgi:hypothetical protein